MTRRSPVARLAVWAFAFALVLKAAVPMMASASAALQGKAVAEVCDVYGVATLALPAAPDADAHAAHANVVDPHAHHHHHGDAAADERSNPAPAPAPAPAHAPHGSGGGDHCVLTALLALSAPDTATVALASASPIDASLIPALGVERVDAPDALARWASLLRHGPPPFLS